MITIIIEIRLGIRGAILHVILLLTTFTHDIYNYTPKTTELQNVCYSVYCSRHSVVTIYGTLMAFPMTKIFYFHISTFHSMCEVSSTAVFCSSLISCFPGMLLR